MKIADIDALIERSKNASVTPFLIEFTLYVAPAEDERWSYLIIEVPFPWMDDPKVFVALGCEISQPPLGELLRHGKLHEVEVGPRGGPLIIFRVPSSSLDGWEGGAVR